MSADSPLIQIKSMKKNTPWVVSIYEVRARQLIAIESLSKSIEGMHKYISFKTNKVRRVEAHNKRTRMKPCNFIVGDFVLKGSVKRFESKSDIMR